MTELWDIYDSDRNPTGRVEPRGSLVIGDYHLVVHIWLMNEKGEILVTQRAQNKPWGLFWETTGGSVLAGETSLQAAVREVRVGATKTIGEFVVAEELGRYIRRTGDSLKIVVDNTQALLGMLEHEQLDFALVEGTFDRRKFGSRLFRKERFVGLCRWDHPFAGRTVSLEELGGQCLVVREEGSGTRGILEDALAQRGYSLDLFSRVICANQFSLITRFVGAGAGVTFAYEPVAAGKPELVPFHLDCLDEHREFDLVYLKGTRVFPLVREVLGELAPPEA